MTSGRRRMQFGIVAVLAFAAGFAVRGRFAEAPDPAAPRDAVPPRQRPAPSRAPERTRAAGPLASAPPSADSAPAADDPSRTAEGLPPQAFELHPEKSSVRPPVLVVRGRCVDASGSPVRATVHVADGPSVVTGEDGRFELTGVPPDAREISFAPARDRYAWHREALRSETAGAVDQGDVVVHAGVALHGRFVDLDGRPVAGREVHLHVADVGWWPRRTRTDDTGAFAFDHVGDGYCVVSGRTPSARIAGDEHDAWVHLPRRDGSDVLLRPLSAWYVRLHFTDEQGGRITVRSGTWSWRALDDANDAAGASWSDSPPWDGFRVPVRVGATYEFRFETAGFLPVVQRFDGTDDPDRRVAVVLRPAAR